MEKIKKLRHECCSKNALTDDERFPLEDYLQDFFGEECLRKIFILMEEYETLADFVGHEGERENLLGLLRWYCECLSANGARPYLWDELSRMCARHHPEVGQIFCGMGVLR